MNSPKADPLTARKEFSVVPEVPEPADSPVTKKPDSIFFKNTAN